MHDKSVNGVTDFLLIVRVQRSDLVENGDSLFVELSGKLVRWLDGDRCLCRLNDDDDDLIVISVVDLVVASAFLVLSLK